MANSKQFGPASGASEGDANSEVVLQVLHEVYFAPHEALAAAGVATIMCAGVEVNEVSSCQNDEMLNLTLRGDWNFTGIVVSDWLATQSTRASMIAGLDWEMGSNTYYTSPLHDDVYVYKNLSESYVNRAVHRILSNYDRFSLLDDHGAQGNSTTLLLTANDLPEDVVRESQEISYNIGGRSGALLKNDGALPLNEQSAIAVLGATGLQLTNGAGFAERSSGFEERKVAPVDALKRAAGSLNVSSAMGVDMHGTLVPNSALRTSDG